MTVIVSVRNNFMSLAVTVTKRLMVSPAILDLLMIVSIGKLTFIFKAIKSELVNNPWQY